jgi:hypothetical protein
MCGRLFLVAILMISTSTAWAGKSRKRKAADELAAKVATMEVGAVEWALVGRNKTPRRSRPDAIEGFESTVMFAKKVSATMVFVASRGERNAAAAHRPSPRLYHVGAEGRVSLVRTSQNIRSLLADVRLGRIRDSIMGQMSKLKTTGDLRFGRKLPGDNALNRVTVEASPASIAAWMAAVSKEGQVGGSVAHRPKTAPNTALAASPRPGIIRTWRDAFMAGGTASYVAAALEHVRSSRPSTPASPADLLKPRLRRTAIAKTVYNSPRVKGTGHK